jgi:hypothetical protein
VFSQLVCTIVSVAVLKDQVIELLLVVSENVREKHNVWFTGITYL